MDRLKDKKALVIGGNTGIGREVCRLFAQEGADVAVGDFGREEAGRSLLADIQALGRDAFPIAVDVRSEDQVRDAVAGAISRFGRLDILVNNAGISGHQGPIQTETIDEWDQVIAVNLRGVFLGMKHVLPHMIERGYGRIINTASQLSHKPSPFNASYCASKAGVVALTVSAAQEVALTGVTVNAVCPGATDTPMWRTPGNESWKEWKINSLPIKRLGQPVEIAWAYVYLASDEASYCLGQSISPNGGDVMW
ncbi:MAG: SDR family NAD(P)-dependent oxidoreductase [Thermomicrobiales bacterium]